MKAFLILSVLAVSVSCTKNKVEAGKKINECNRLCAVNQICTEVFIHSKLKIEFSDGRPYTLDSFKTIRTEDNKILDPAIQYTEAGSLDNGDYPIFNDNFISLTDPCGKEFYFIGYKNNIEVVKEKYIFSHDCCHMLRLSGKSTLVIE